jgi:trehalose synthase
LLWDDLCRIVEGYAAALFPAARLVRNDIPVPRIGIAHPALDPLSLRNVPLTQDQIETVLIRLGIDPRQPILGQFSPIDHRFAPLGALGTYWLVRRAMPDVQMVLAEVGLTDADRRRFGLGQVAEAAAGDPAVHVLTREMELGPTEINALERACAVALQMAIPRGFAMGLAECMWKERPCIVGRHGEMPEQVGDAGLVVDSAPAAADAALQLLDSPAMAAQRGRRGHDRVAEKYLVTGLLSDYVDMLREVVGVHDLVDSVK